MPQPRVCRVIASLIMMALATPTTTLATSDHATLRPERASLEELERGFRPSAAGLEEWDQRVAEGYREATVAVLGGTGFVGRRYVGTLLEWYGETVGQIRALSRNPDGVAASLGTHPKLAPYQGDHLDLERVRALIAGATIIIDTAGLAWQHLPGGKAATLEDELLQNSMSAALIGAALQSGQRLVWTSSNASDYMFARMTETEQATLQREIDERAARYAAWVRGLADRAPTGQELDEFIRGDLDAYSPQSFPDGPEGSDQKTVVYARAFSYPYSKLLGQRILEIMGQEDGKEIMVLKISDVYGPGQGLGPEYWDPTPPESRDPARPPRQAARRPQWFLAAYEAVRAGDYEPWARTPTENGFLEVDGHIQHTVFDDVVAPTYVDDVIEMLFKASVAELPIGPQRQVVLAVSTPWMTNAAMAQAIANAVGVKALGQDIAVMPGKQILRREPPPASADLAVLGMDGRLTPFEDGIARHLAWWRAQAPATADTGLEEPTMEQVEAAASWLQEFLGSAPMPQSGVPTVSILGREVLRTYEDHPELQALVGVSDRILLITGDSYEPVIEAIPAGTLTVGYYGNALGRAALENAIRRYRPGQMAPRVALIEMGSIPFEAFLQQLFEHLGYSAEVVQANLTRVREALRARWLSSQL